MQTKNMQNQLNSILLILPHFHFSYNTNKIDGFLKST